MGKQSVARLAVEFESRDCGIPDVEELRVAGAAASGQESQRHVDSTKSEVEVTAAAKLQPIFESQLRRGGEFQKTSWFRKLFLFILSEVVSQQ